MPAHTKATAQQRVDRVLAFQEELETLQKEQVLTLPSEQKSSVQAYHSELLAKLTESFDVDIDKHQKQLSLGMKIASFLGALALGASLFYLFRQFWGLVTTPVQVVILSLAPVVTLLATYALKQKEKSGYFSKLLGLVSFVCMALNIFLFGSLFNITPSENAFLVLACYAFLLAYAADMRLLLGAGILSLAGFLSAKVGVWCGLYWANFGEQPENFFLPALLLFWLPALHRNNTDFDPIYRVFSLLFLFVPMLILANWGQASYLALSNDVIEVFYQVLGFVLSGAAIWLGVRQHWPEVTNSGNAFFTLFLYTKFYDWWWQWMPKYLFFFLVSLVAILMLFVFKRLRQESNKAEEVDV